MNDMDSVRSTLRMVTAGFAIGPVILVVVLALIDLGEPESPDMVDGATAAVGLLGVLGLLVAVLWFSNAGDRPRSPGAITNGFIIRVAIAELGLLLGIVGRVLTGSMLPIVVGLGLFLPALLLLYLGMNRMVET